MDFQSIVDSLCAPTCIVSVKKRQDGSCGDIRLVTGNKKYIDMVSVRKKSGSSNTESDSKCSFVPNTLYTDYFPQSINFEDVCFRAAVLKKEVHTYAHINNVDVWFDIYAMPLEYEDLFCCAK